MNREFDNFAVIDWSGEAVARPKGLALAHAGRGTDAPTLLAPEGGWSRQAILDWLLLHADARTNMLIGLDLSPALPFVDEGAYFPGWEASPSNASALWAMVDDLSRESPHLSAGVFLAGVEPRRHFRYQDVCGDLFSPGRGRLRVCELGQREMGLSPSSCFNLIGAAQVGKSSLTGMRVLHRLRDRIPVWPITPLREQGPIIVEIYTSIAARAAGVRRGRSKIRDGEALDNALAAVQSSRHRTLARYDDHATDAILTTAWLRNVAGSASLWSPPALTADIARTEGWTFGVA